MVAAAPQSERLGSRVWSQCGGNAKAFFVARASPPVDLAKGETATEIVPSPAPVLLTSAHPLKRAGTPALRGGRIRPEGRPHPA